MALAMALAVTHGGLSLRNARRLSLTSIAIEPRDPLERLVASRLGWLLNHYLVGLWYEGLPRENLMEVLLLVNFEDLFFLFWKQPSGLSGEGGLQAPSRISELFAVGYE